MCGKMGHRTLEAELQRRQKSLGANWRGGETKSPGKKEVKMMRTEVITTWREKEHFSSFLYLW